MFIDCRTSETNYVNTPIRYGEPCKFPFVYKGKMHFSPTLDGPIEHLDYRPWCATKTDEFHNVIPFNEKDGIIPDQDGRFNIGIVDYTDSCPHNGK